MYLSLIIAAATSVGNPAPGKAYLVIDAVATFETARQPTWIGLLHRLRVVHVPTGEYVVEIEPDRYEIHHFDFKENMKSGDGTRYLASPLVLRLEPEKIYLVGRFELKLGRMIARVIDQELLNRACERAPDLFEQYPLRIPFGETPEEDIRVSCHDPMTGGSAAPNNRLQADAVNAHRSSSGTVSRAAEPER